MFFGAHLSSAGGIDTTLDRAEAIGAEAVQLFTQSPRMWRPTNHARASFERFRARRAELGIAEGGVLAHALYLINLAASDREIGKKSQTALNTTIDVANAIGADGVVFHVGSHLGAGLADGLKRCVPPLAEAADRCTGATQLLLENSAGAGGTIGRSIDELATVFDACDRHERLGICLDTCHLYVSGVDVTKRPVVDALLDEVDDRIGLDRLRALHVNDARDALGSNRDRHADVGEGTMGTKIGAFLGNPRLQGLPAFLETPGPDKHGPDANQLRRVRRIHKRWAATAG